MLGGDGESVKKGIWESAVDAAGGEIQHGHEEYVKMQPTDPKETLLHLAVRAGDKELVEWLDTHSAYHLPLVLFCGQLTDLVRCRSR